MPPGESKLGHASLFDSDMKQNSEAFIQSSNKVRNVIVVLSIVNILIFCGHYNSIENSWINTRLKISRVALKAKVFKPQPGPEQEEVSRARSWYKRRGFSGPKDLLHHIQSLDQARTEHVLLMQMPVFGITFDVNDLGFLGGISMLIVMLMLVFSMARQHENLYLALWKVRDIWRAESQLEDRNSAANLMYHSLAMSQHFSMPPTLARWGSRRLQKIAGSLLVLPLATQIFGLIHDLRTRDQGITLSLFWTNESIVIQSVIATVLLFLTYMCWSYSNSNAKRWEYTFRRINSRLPEKCTPWLIWVQQKKRVPGRHYDISSHSTLKNVRTSIDASQLEH